MPESIKDDPVSQHKLQSSENAASISILTLNCWGLKYLSAYRSERLSQIGCRLASHSPALDLVGLQECWTYADYVAIRDRTRHVLPYGKFYHSGVFGGGLVILSKWPIQDSSMFRYPLNGRPTAFFRGDWFVGKGVACARIQMPSGQVIEVFNTHLHAPYEREPNDSYICHRTAQAWEIAKLMRDASERGSLVVGLGDFNMVPMSFAHVLIESRGGGVRDIWRILKPGSSIGASVDDVERERRARLGETKSPDVDESLKSHGHTCDSVLNTWRWSKQHQKDLRHGRDRIVSPSDEDARAKRLDYIFFNGSKIGWKVTSAKVTMTERHPTLKCSLSDHFAVHATITRSWQTEVVPKDIDVTGVQRDADNVEPSQDMVNIGDKDFGRLASAMATQSGPTLAFYEEIVLMVRAYTLRERKQRRWRLAHFLVSAIISIGCFVTVWWSPSNYVSFILILISSLGLMAGTVDGLIGGLFVGSELRALNEFEWEVRNAIESGGGPKNEDMLLRDWYD